MTHLGSLAQGTTSSPLLDRGMIAAIELFALSFPVVVVDDTLLLFNLLVHK